MPDDKVNLWWFISAATAKEDDPGQSKEEGDQSDYFADVETTSCDSSELDFGWSAFEDGVAHDKATPCGSFKFDVGFSYSEDGEGVLHKLYYCHFIEVVQTYHLQRCCAGFKSSFMETCFAFNELTQLKLMAKTSMVVNSVSRFFLQ